jgi:hypothetical protein
MQRLAVRGDRALCAAASWHTPVPAQGSSCNSRVSGYGGSALSLRLCTCVDHPVQQGVRLVRRAAALVWWDLGQHHAIICLQTRARSQARGSTDAHGLSLAADGDIDSGHASNPAAGVVNKWQAWTPVTAMHPQDSRPSSQAEGKCKRNASARRRHALQSLNVSPFTFGPGQPMPSSVHSFLQCPMWAGQGGVKARAPECCISRQSTCTGACLPWPAGAALWMLGRQHVPATHCGPGAQAAHQLVEAPSQKHVTPSHAGQGDPRVASQRTVPRHLLVQLVTSRAQVAE